MFRRSKNTWNIENYLTEMGKKTDEPVPEDVQNNVHINWKQLKETISEADKTLKKRKKNNKVWFDEDCTINVEERAKCLWLNDLGNERL